MPERSESFSRRSLMTRAGLALAAGTVARALAAQAVASGEIAGGKDSPTFSSDVKVVNILATVRTKGGEIVANLTKDDFLLSEDNRPQVLKYFSRETDLPLILGLLVDTSGSQRNVLGEEETASYRFLEKVLRNIDRTFLAHFDFDTELLQEMTSSKEKLRIALDGLDMPNQANRRGGGGGYGGYGGRGSRGGRGGGSGGGTTLYDAVYLASDDIMRHEQGRKAVILLTDGVDHGSKVSLNTAIEAAQRADTLVYSILFEGIENGGGRGPFGINIGGEDGSKVLQKMSRETGGGFFEVSRKQPIDTIYRRIEEELRSQYSLGYTPDRPPAGGGFRTISLKARRKELVVQARQGYYPVE